MSKNNKKGGYSVNHTSDLYNRFYNLAINRFTWDNLPSGLTSRKMEEMLIKKGMLFFHRTKEGALVCLPCTGVTEYNIYNEPIQYNVIGYNYNEYVDIDDGVVIRNNASGEGDDNDLWLFAERINEVEQTMDVNLFQQNLQSILLVDEKQRLTVQNILRQVKEFKYAIIGRKGLDFGSADILNSKVDYILDKLQTHKTALMNELLTFLGINNSNIEKKERLIVDEVNSNNEFILVNIDHMYDERKKAVEEINKMFNLNITVEKREVEGIGTIHNDDIGDITRQQ